MRDILAELYRWTVSEDECRPNPACAELLLNCDDSFVVRSSVQPQGATIRSCCLAFYSRGDHGPLVIRVLLFAISFSSIHCAIKKQWSSPTYVAGQRARGWRTSQAREVRPFDRGQDQKRLRRFLPVHVLEVGCSPSHFAGHGCNQHRPARISLQPDHPAQCSRRGCRQQTSNRQPTPDWRLLPKLHGRNHPRRQGKSLVAAAPECHRFPEIEQGSAPGRGLSPPEFSLCLADVERRR